MSDAQWQCVGTPVSLQLLSEFHQTGPGLAQLGVTAEARTGERDLRPGREAAEPQLTQTPSSESEVLRLSPHCIAKCLKSICDCTWFFCHVHFVLNYRTRNHECSRRRIQKGLLKVWNKCYLGDSDLHNCCQSFHPSLSCIHYIFYHANPSTFNNRLWRWKFVNSQFARERALCLVQCEIRSNILFQNMDF